MQKLYKYFTQQNTQNNLASEEMSGEEEAFENLLTDGKNLPNFPNIRSHPSSPGKTQTFIVVTLIHPLISKLIFFIADFALIQLVLLIFTFVVALWWAFCCRKSNTVQVRSKCNQRFAAHRKICLQNEGLTAEFSKNVDHLCP